MNKDSAALDKLFDETYEQKGLFTPQQVEALKELQGEIEKYAGVDEVIERYNERQRDKIRHKVSDLLRRTERYEKAVENGILDPKE